LSVKLEEINKKRCKFRNRRRKREEEEEKRKKRNEG
jgi:hypothetical protein